VGDRSLSDDDRRMIVAALLGARAQALQVAACWDPATGNIPKAVGVAGASELHQGMLALAEDQQRLARDIIDPDFELRLAKRP
jgi:hypothetical protein